MLTVTGSVAVVTGGANGIGKGLAQALLERGAAVVLADVDRAALRRAVDELAPHGTVRDRPTDVSDPDDVDALADEVFERDGGCQLLFNNAAVMAAGGEPWEAGANDWRWLFGVNVFGVANGVRSFVPRMIASGRPSWVVNTSSADGGLATVAGSAVYSASKAAMTCLTEALATRLAASPAPVGASLFIPSGGLLETALWESERLRPDALPRQGTSAPAPVRSLAEFREMLRSSGREVRLMDLVELGRFVLDGVQEERFLIAHEMEEVGAVLRERVDALSRGERPPEFAGLTIRRQLGSGSLPT